MPPYVESLRKLVETTKQHSHPPVPPNPAMTASVSRDEGPQIPVSREASSAGDVVKKFDDPSVETPKRASLPVRIRDKLGLDVGTLCMMFKSVYPDGREDVVTVRS